MMSNVAISLLGVEHSKRVELTNKLIGEGMKWVHYDLMDGQFVPTTAISVPQMKEIVENTKPHIVDAHFMVKNPRDWFEESKDFIDYATLHFEAVDEAEIMSIIEDYRGEINVGIAINPDTNVDEIEHLIPFVNHILVMSVQPGKGGQSFNESALKKVELIKSKILEQDLMISIGIDGGINNETGPRARAAGVDVLVSGSYLAKSPTQATLKEIEGITK